MDQWLARLDAHSTVVWWIAAASVLMFFASLIIIPVIIARIPHDYFSHRTRPRWKWAGQHFIVRAVARIAKNALGAMLLLLGLAMLMLPGQGLLCMTAGLLLLDFPRKYRFQRWLVSRRPLLRSINWIRRKAGRAPLIIE